MAGNILEKFGTSNQTITCTLASLTNTSVRQATVVDNSSNVFNEALVHVKVKSGGSGTATTGYVNVYAYGTADGGTTYTEGASGSDGSITLTSPTNARWIGSINVVANATTYNGGPFPVSPAFGGTLPEKWGIIIENQSGGTLDSTEGNHGKWYQGVYGQYT